MHPAYDHLYTPLTPPFFLGMTILFLYQTYCCAGQEFQKQISNLKSPYQSLLKTYFPTRKILQNFEGHGNWYCRHITFWVIYNFSKWTKHGHVILPGALPNKVTPDIDFKYDAMVECDIQVVKIPFRLWYDYR